MSDSGCRAGLRIFATCPPSYGAAPVAYTEEVARVARWSEEAGCHGLLIYSDNALPDPWLLAQTVIRETVALAPLVAVQPVYMHPYAVAKMVATLGFLHRRRICLNMVAGGFRNDLLSLDDPTPHDERYLRLIEYTRVVLDLLAAEGPFSFQGKYYRLANASLKPPLPPELRPEVLVSGSSDAGNEAARRLGAVAVRYPKPAAEYLAAPGTDLVAPGIRIGIIARENGVEAWKVARERFPESRKGQLMHELAMKVSDSQWHREISALQGASGLEDDPYWTVPFTNYSTFCPYLVGSYERVAEEIGRYAGAGYRTVIMDVPPNAEELRHAFAVCHLATRQVAA